MPQRQSTDARKDMHAMQSLSDFFDRLPAAENLGLAPSVERLYRRVERVVAAVFLATNHIPQEDTVRVSARAAGIRLLEATIALRDEMRASQSPRISEFRAVARELVSILRMLSIAGLLSTQNASILIEAIDGLGSFLRASQSSALSETVSFSKHDFLDAPEAVKDTSYLKDTVYLKDKSTMSDNQTKKTLHARKQNILEVLKNRDEMSVTDIASNLPEYSAKMVQRDLVELIATGAVKKVGLKRWSRYSLAR